MVSNLPHCWLHKINTSEDERIVSADVEFVKLG